MQYSPLKTLRIKNFRNIGDITIDFSESPIISLVGENEAGKTSIIKSVEVLGLNANYKDQKDYIRDGQVGFGIVAETVDNTMVGRVKTNASNVYEISKVDGYKWSCDKLDSSDAPVEVQNVMGLIKEPETGEFLHIRTYEDKLLFVITPASSNYKVMYNALKVDHISKALKNGSDKINQLRGSIDIDSTKVDTLLEQVRKIRLYDIEPIVNIKQRVAREFEQLQKLEKAAELASRIKEIDSKLGLVAEIVQNNLQPLELAEVNTLIQINRNIKRVIEINKLLAIYSEAATAQPVDASGVSRLKYAVDRKVILQGMDSKIRIFENLQSAESINGSIYSKLRNAALKSVSLAQLLAKTGYSEVAGLNSLEATVIVRLREAQEKAKHLQGINIKLSKLNIEQVTAVTQKDINTVVKAGTAAQLLSKIYILQQGIEEADTKANEVSGLLKQSGALVATCPKCGETVIMRV